MVAWTKAAPQTNGSLWFAATKAPRPPTETSPSTCDPKWNAGETRNKTYVVWRTDVSSCDTTKISRISPTTARDTQLLSGIYLASQRLHRGRAFIRQYFHSGFSRVSTPRLLTNMTVSCRHTDYLSTRTWSSSSHLSYPSLRIMAIGRRSSSSSLHTLHRPADYKSPLRSFPQKAA